jgi:hypothetical protein
MIPRRGQGVAGEVSGSLGHSVEGSLQLVDPRPFTPRLFQVEPLPISFVSLQGGDEQRILAPRHVFRRDSTPSPD